MTLKEKLLEDKYKFIPNFDFTVELSMRDECMLNYLIDIANYFDIDLDDNTPFEITPEFIRKRKPAWGIRQIRDSLVSLCELGFITKVGNKGRGNLYVLCNDKILEVCLSSENYAVRADEEEEGTESISSPNKMLKEVMQNVQAASTKCETNNNTNKNKNNNNIYSQNTDKYSEEIEEIISYFNEKTNQRLRSSTKSHRKIISARLREGFTVDDFKTIIDKKYEEWKDTEFEKYIRPSTLFIESHFDVYLNQPCSKKNNSSKVKRTKWDGTLISNEVF